MLIKDNIPGNNLLMCGRVLKLISFCLFSIAINLHLQVHKSSFFPLDRTSV